METKDETLIAASLRGEREAFGKLVERCADMVRAVAYAATRDRALSDDITQETFAVAWRDLAGLRDAKAVRPWLCRIARNIAHKVRRRRVKEVAVSAADAERVASSTPFDALREQEIESVVAHALARIPQIYREALVLFYFEQRSASDVAAALGVTEQVVHKRLSRGRRYLAAGIEQLVETHLENRRDDRPRREVALLVLSALPPALPVSNVVTKGPFMKLGALGLPVAVVGFVAISSHVGSATPRNRATPPGKKPAAAPATVKRAASPRPALPTRFTCASAAQHIVAVSLHAFDSPAVLEEHAPGVARVTKRLERMCQDEAWDGNDLACVHGADETREIAACRPKERPVEVPALKLDDLTCATVGKHMGRLMIAELDAFDGDVAASVLTPVDELPAQAVEACKREEWSIALRRCYAGATRYKQTVICNVNIRDAD